ncbi:MAG: TetR/AcrR family transcriptional regulator [Archangium sp.]|nr:TetR/AcrR family transcriptional regulator [Archangium sp.]
MAATKARKRRSSYHHGDLSNALVRAAIDLISSENSEQITLREVSRRVGVNHRAVYRHFSDLTSLLAAVAEQGYGELLATLQHALATLPAGKGVPKLAARRMEALAIAYVGFAFDRPAHYRIMFGRRMNEDGRFPALEGAALKAYELLQSELDAGVATGEFKDRPRRELVFGFWSLTHGFASLALVRRIKLKRTFVEPYVRQIVGPFIAGL